jgi:hypothetical protein
VSLAILFGTTLDAQTELRSAHISDCPSSSVPAWSANETSLFKKIWEEVDLVFIDGSTRGIQSPLAGELSFPNRSDLRRSTAGSPKESDQHIVHYVLGKANIEGKT